MTKKFCDVCGKEAVRAPICNLKAGKHELRVELFITGVSETPDLCKDCFLELAKQLVNKIG